jgi:hypothetical protein
MSAKNGLAVSFRRRGRLIGCCVALVCAVSALFASSAGAVVPVTSSYMALGDSLAFGYSQQLFNENQALGDPATAFNHGYVNVYYTYQKPLLNGIQLQNNGCPGETTDSMIGNGGLAAAFGIPGEAPCKYHNTEAEENGGPPGFKLPLHHTYNAPQSQLENALETLAVDQLTGKPVTLITLNIGANDELHSIGKCKAEIAAEWGTEGKSKNYGGATPEQSFNNCLVAHVPALFAHILGNIGKSLYAIRNAHLFNGVPGTDYTGKIVVQGGYDPYGNVFGTGELLKGSKALAQILNVKEGKLVSDSGTEAAEEGHPPFGACYANPEPKFNPLLVKTESERLQKWTNMANFTEFAGKKNGPDIHPTPAGYKTLASIMIVSCP